MSILIKGLKIPKNCCECFAFKTNASGMMFCRAGKTAFEKEDAEWLPLRVSDHCPLIELPDHGDLIDRDAFIKANREYLCTDCGKRKGVKNGRMRLLYEIGGVPCRACGVEDMFEYLDDAPVVISAERSKE